MPDYKIVGADPVTGQMPEAVEQRWVDVTVASPELSATIDAAVAEAGTVSSSALNHRPPLVDVPYKAANGTFRVLLTGTSISSFDNAPVRLLGEHLKTLYGDSLTVIYPLGVQGGSFDTAPGYSGWSKQRYGGAQFTRMRGATGAATLTFLEYGDTIIIEYGRETDSAAFEVKCDGVSLGTVGGPGAQAYLTQTFTVAEGAHKIEILPPTSAGYAYLHTLEVRSANRRGVDVLDFTMGGAGMWNMTELMAKTAPQVDGIPIVGENGLNYYFDRPDVDCFVIEHIVNDRSHPDELIANAQWAVEKTAQLGKSIMFIIEPMYLYSTDIPYQEGRAGLLALSQHPHVTVIDWHGAIYTPDDIPGFQARYWPGADKTHPNQLAYDVLSSQIAVAAGLPYIPSKSALAYANERLYKFVATDGAQRAATIEGVAQTIQWAEGPALIPRVAKETTQAINGYRDYVYRVNVATNRVSGEQAAIYASGLSDEWGKYTDYTSASLFKAVNWLAAGGASEVVTIRANGTFFVSVNGGLRLADLAGNVFPITTSTDITRLRHVVGSAKPLTFSFRILRESGTSSNIQIQGKLRDLTIANVSVPVLDTV